MFTNCLGNRFIYSLFFEQTLTHNQQNYANKFIMFKYAVIFNNVDIFSRYQNFLMENTFLLN